MNHDNTNMITNDNNNNNKHTKTYSRLDSSVHSSHTMVDVDTVLHFFSMDASHESLVKLFGVTNVHEERKVENNNIKIDETIDIDKNMDIQENIVNKNKKSISLSNWCFMNCLDNKSRNMESHHLKRQDFDKTINLENLLQDIETEYDYITNKSKHFSGWNYYEENKKFIETYFDKSNTYKKKNRPPPCSHKYNSTLILPNISKNNIKTYKLHIDTDLSSEPGLFGPIEKSDSLTPIIEEKNDITNNNLFCIEDSKNHICIKDDDKDYTYVYINKKVECLEDLLYLIDKYPIRSDIKYNIDMSSLHNIAESLRKLNSMIGLHTLKQSIVYQIIYYIQNFHLLGNNENDYMHTVIYGPPGTGKTEIAKIIGEIFSKLGILQSNTFKKVTRADLVAGYLGQTAIKTKNIIQECLGGVLFIDEAYSLGNTEKGDSFSKECIDTLCESLSHHKHEIMVIIAGYKEELNKCFFSYNEGLESRFSWRYETEEYSAEELKKIFEKKVKDANWSTIEELPESWFEKNKKYFKYYGRDIETLFAKTKISHSARVFCKPSSFKTKISVKDITKGLQLYLKNNTAKNEQKVNTSHMYV